MELFITLSVILISSALIWFVSRPFLAIIKLKLKFGRYVYVNYSFPIGEFALWDKSLRKYNDVNQSYRCIYTYSLVMIQQNKHVKFIIGNILSEPFIQIIDPSYTKQIFIEHQNYEKYEAYGAEQISKIFSLIAKQGLVFTTGHQWKRQRALLGESFQFAKLKARVPMINQVVKEKLSQDYSERTLDLATQIAGTVVIRSFFGQQGIFAKINGNDPIDEIVSILNEIQMLENTGFITFKKILLGTNIWKYFLSKREKALLNRINNLKEFSKNIVQNRIQHPNQDEQDFLDIYVNEYNKQGNEITIEEIIHQFITLFFAGTDTTSNSTYICLYHLAIYPDAQQEILNEIRSVIGDGDVNEEHLNRFPIMSAFIQEVFRLRNPALYLFPRIVKQPHYIKDLKLEKDWLILPAINLVQISADHYDDPMTFNYRRFLDKQNPHNDNGFVNIPFSAGGRNCIGQHMALIKIKIILAHIIRQYRVTLNENVKVTWEFKFLYSFEPQNAVKLVPRQ